MSVTSDERKACEDLLAEVQHLRATLANNLPLPTPTLNGYAKPFFRACDPRFAQCIEQLPDCFGLFVANRDSTGRITDFHVEYLNPAACNLHRMPLDRQLGRFLCELLPGHRTSGLFDAFCQVVETGIPWEARRFEYADRCGDRVLRRWFDIRAFRIDDGFASTWRDVTDRHIDELALREREDRLQLALRAGRMGIWEWHVETGEVYWSAEASLQTIGVARERRCTLDDFRELVHPDDRDILWHKVQRAIDGGQPFEHEFRIFSPSGEVRWVANAAILQRDESGNPMRMVGTVSDVTDRRLALHMLEKRTSELRDAEEKLRRIGGDI